MSTAWWWALIQIKLRRQDKCFGSFLFLYGTFGKLGSIIFFLEYYQKPFVPEEKSLVMPSCWVWCPYGPLGLLAALFRVFLPVFCSLGRMSGISNLSPGSAVYQLSATLHTFLNTFRPFYPSLSWFGHKVDSATLKVVAQSSSTNVLREFLQQFCLWICLISKSSSWFDF